MIQDWVLVTNEYITFFHCTEEEAILAATEAGAEYYPIAVALELGIIEQWQADFETSLTCSCCP